MLDALRADRIFDSFLDTQGRSVVEGIKKLRNHRRARRLAADSAYELYSKENYDGTFIEWLIENQDTILALITKIISMFAL